MLRTGRLHTLARGAGLIMMARTPARALRLVTGASDRPEPLVVPRLSPSRIFVRPNSSDRSVLYMTLWGEVDDLAADVPRDRATRIWDLGANIGLTAALYAMTRPKARITGVELDDGNAELARRNTAVFGERCNIITGAVWIDDGVVDYVIASGREQEARVGAGGSGRPAASHALNTLFARDDWIDFVKMDVEGAERQILRERTEWASKVGCIKVECHAPYSVREATRDLESLGFAVEVSSTHRASVTGRRPYPASG